MLKIFLFSLGLLIITGTANCQNEKTSEDKIKPDSIANQKSTEVKTEDKVFTNVENEAEFAGGTTAWITYLQNNLNANTPVKKGAPAGTYNVVVKFIVSKDGSINNIEAETNHGYGMEKEVIRIIKKGPKWIPAQQNGRPVNAYRRQPVTFVVSNG